MKKLIFYSILVLLFFPYSLSYLCAQIDNYDKVLLTEYYTKEFSVSYYNNDGKLGERLNKIINDQQNEKSLMQCAESIWFVNVYKELKKQSDSLNVFAFFNLLLKQKYPVSKIDESLADLDKHTESLQSHRLFTQDSVFYLFRVWNIISRGSEDEPVRLPDPNRTDPFQDLTNKISDKYKQERRTKTPEECIKIVEKTFPGEDELYALKMRVKNYFTEKAKDPSDVLEIERKRDEFMLLYFEFWYYCDRMGEAMQFCENKIKYKENDLTFCKGFVEKKLKELKEVDANLDRWNGTFYFKDPYGNGYYVHTISVSGDNSFTWSAHLTSTDRKDDFTYTDLKLDDNYSQNFTIHGKVTGDYDNPGNNKKGKRHGTVDAILVVGNSYSEDYVRARFCESKESEIHPNNDWGWVNIYREKK